MEDISSLFDKGNFGAEQGMLYDGKEVRKRQ